MHAYHHVICIPGAQNLLANDLKLKLDMTLSCKVSITTGIFVMTHEPPGAVFPCSNCVSATDVVHNFIEILFNI
jgi:hypothetical protein